MTAARPVSRPLNTGTHTVGETAGIGTDLADYQKSIVCKGANGTGSIVAQTSGDSAGPLNVTVRIGDDIVCTITNTRETGTLVVAKDLSPYGDPGKFICRSTAVRSGRRQHR